jgi:hypothetical protein
MSSDEPPVKRVVEPASRCGGVCEWFATRIGIKRFAVLGWSLGRQGISGASAALPGTGVTRRAHRDRASRTGPGGDSKPWLERAVKAINDLGDEEVLFFELKSASSRKAAMSSRARIYRSRDELVSARWPDLVLPESGHGPQHQYPALSAKYIATFLQLIRDPCRGSRQKRSC